MWSICETVGRQKIAALIDHGANTRRIVHLPGDEYFQIICDAEQPAVEHPVGCAR